MKKKFFLYTAAGILLAALLIFFAALPGRSPAPGQFRIETHEEIVKIEMQGRGDRHVSLERAPDGQWWLNESFRANESAVRDLLNVLRRMETRRPVPLADRMAVSVMKEREGVQVGVYAAGKRIQLPGGISAWPYQKRIRRFTFAGYSPGGGAAYLQMHGSQEPYEVQLAGVSGQWAEVFRTMEHHWLDPVIIHLPAARIRQVELDFPGDEAASFRISRLEDQTFHLADQWGHAIEMTPRVEARIHHYLNGFVELYYQRLIPNSSDNPPADLMPHGPFARLTVGGDDAPPILLAFYRRLPPGDGSLQSPHRDYDINRLYVRINGGDYALAQYYVFQRVLRPLSYFVKQPGQSG